jgi:hypothetical protein
MAIERLGDEDLQGDALQEEIERARAVAGIAGQIIANGNLALRAHMTAVEWESMSKRKLPLMLAE